MKKLITLALTTFALCSLLGAINNANNANLYVDGTNGSDENHGLCLELAKKTIQAAINIANAGDTILVAPGTYEPIETTNKLITIKSLKGAAQTIIDASGKKRCVTAVSADDWPI